MTAAALTALVFAALAAARKATAETKEEATAVARDAWLEAGGCPICGGHRRVLTWATLDGSGWDEFGPCPGVSVPIEGPPTRSEMYSHGMAIAHVGCKHPKGLGLMPGGRYPGSGHRCGNNVDLDDPKFNALQKDLETREVCWNQISRNLELAKGHRVRVVKGRKVKPGTEGVVFWLGSNRWGLRAGIEDDSGQVHWVAADNLQVVCPDAWIPAGTDFDGSPEAFEALAAKSQAWAEENYANARKRAAAYRARNAA